MFVSDDVIIEKVVEQTDARNLTKDDLESLFHWTGRQYDHFFEDVPVQEILDVYHASKKFRDFQDWFERAPAEAGLTYNKIITNKNRRIIIQ